LLQVWRDLMLFSLMSNTGTNYLYSTALLPIPHRTAML
jgi:hypothetical protein